MVSKGPVNSINHPDFDIHSFTHFLIRLLSISNQLVFDLLPLQEIDRNIGTHRGARKLYPTLHITLILSNHLNGDNQEWRE